MTTGTKPDGPASAMTTRAHGTRTRYKHGPDENDQPGRGCHCKACTAANTAYIANRERQRIYGRWQPYVDAQPARDHLSALSAAGVGRRRAAALSGVPDSVLSRILYGGPGDRPPAARIRSETEAKILAVVAGLDTLGNRAIIDATGSQRRLQALVAVGYSQASLGARLNITPQNFGTTMRTERITAATARAIRGLYDQLWNVPPDESTHRARIAASRARNTALRNGWPPPMAWDDDEIDDPHAGPPEGWQRPRHLSSADQAAEAAELISWEGTVSLAAERMGVRRDALAKAISRAGQAS